MVTLPLNRHANHVAVSATFTSPLSSTPTNTLATAVIAVAAVAALAPTTAAAVTFTAGGRVSMVPAFVALPIRPIRVVVLVA